MTTPTPSSPAETDLAGILDLFEELVYVGEITPDGHYVPHSSGPTVERFLGGRTPAGAERAVGVARPHRRSRRVRPVQPAAC